MSTPELAHSSSVCWNSRECLRKQARLRCLYPHQSSMPDCRWQRKCLKGRQVLGCTFALRTPSRSSGSHAIACPDADAGGSITGPSAQVAPERLITRASSFVIRKSSVVARVSNCDQYIPRIPAGTWVAVQRQVGPTIGDCEKLFSIPIGDKEDTLPAKDLASAGWWW